MGQRGPRRVLGVSTAIDRMRLRRSSSRLAVWIGVAAVLGATVGLVVVAFQWAILDATWPAVEGWPLWALALAPGIGVGISVAVVHLSRTRTSATAEEYIRVFHDRGSRMRLLELPAKIAAGVATIGLGGSMGLEGPSLLTGGTLGDAVQSRLGRLFEAEEAKVLLVAGGAAGISAVFKAPLTGLVFAMEVPFRDDIARHVLGPALVASATAYLVEATARGVGPLVPIVGSGGFALSDVLRSMLLGFVVGLVGRVLVVAFRWVSTRLARLSLPWRLAIAAVVLGGVVLACDALYGRALALGPGEEAIEAATIGGLSLGALLALLGLKALATSVTAGGGGVGGLFFPLVVMGTALGGAFDHLLPGPRGTLLPLVGMASLLGAVYHTPLAGVSFVAEATGRVGFVIPTFVATAAAYATIGSASISERQRFRRAGPIEGMLDMPVADVLSAEVIAVPQEETVAGFVDGFALPLRHPAFPVVDATGRYLGMAALEHALEVPADARATTPVSEITTDDAPVGDASWSIREALEVMASSAVEVLAVVDAERHLVGSVVTSEIFRLDEILERLRRDGGRHG